MAAGLLTRRQLDSRDWRRLYTGIYVAAGVSLDHAGWCRAAALSLAGRGAVSGPSAAYLSGADALRREAPVEVTVPDQVRLAARPGLVVVRSTLARSDLTRIDGIPVTTAERTAFDLARRAPLVEAVVGVDALLATGWVTVDDVRRYAARHPNWPGQPQLRACLDLVDPGAESPMETRTRLVLVHGGLPTPETQIEVRDASGRQVGRLDMGYRKQRVGIEYEGAHHREADAFQRDLRRLNALAACGWQVLRFGPADIYRNPAEVVRRVRAALS